jgi:hypothetical protein
MKLGRDIFRLRNVVHASLFIVHSGRTHQVRPMLSLRAVAGFGAPGPPGPRTGISSGRLPGSSCGCAGASGSRTGGGISGRGLPGGDSCGGSVGFAGVAGGISGGSIGITSRPCGCRRRDPGRTCCRWSCRAPGLASGATTAAMPRGSVRHNGPICGKPVPTFPDHASAGTQNQRRVAAGLAGLGIAAGAHVGDAVIEPLVSR